MKEVIHSERAPAAIGPYSQAIRAGNFVFISGQLPINPLKDELIAKPFGEAVHQVIKNIRAILQASGMDFENLVQATVYLKNLKNFQEFNSIYSTYFKTEPPSRVVVEVSELPRSAELEISGIAFKAHS